jgi:hypothetical protein
LAATTPAAVDLLVAGADDQMVNPCPAPSRDFGKKLTRHELSEKGWRADESPSSSVIAECHA